jgi:hypothetical protein
MTVKEAIEIFADKLGLSPERAMDVALAIVSLRCRGSYEQLERILLSNNIQPEIRQGLETLLLWKQEQE